MRVRSPDWLKAAALYWDSMRRFQPPDYPLRDSPVSRQLIECGFLKSVNPEYYAADVGSDLLGFMQENVRALQGRFSLRAVLEGPAGPGWGTEGPDGDDKRLGWVHSRKLSYEFSEFLVGEGLGQIGRGTDSRWVGLHPTMAAAYMLALVGACAGRERLAPVTDNPNPLLSPAQGVDAAIRLLTRDAVARPPDLTIHSGVTGFAMTAIDFVMPRDLSEVSVEYLLKTKERLQEELTAFREYVADQGAELKRLASVRDREIRIEAFASHFSARIEKPLERLERGFKLSGLDTGRSLLTTQTFAPPALLAATGELGHVPPVVIAVGGVAAVIGNAWWQLAGANRQQIRESPVGYLLSIKRAMKARTVVERKAKLLSRLE